MRYADTSVLVPLYHAELRSPAVAVKIQSSPIPLIFSWLHEIEFQNALRLKAFRGEATDVEIQATLEMIRTDAATGILRRVNLSWDEVFRQTLALSCMHSAALGTRSLDVLHVACAVLTNATEFITCDQRQARLAEAVGLSVTQIP